MKNESAMQALIQLLNDYEADEMLLHGSEHSDFTGSVTVQDIHDQVADYRRKLLPALRGETEAQRECP
ncbi:hypothetical protein, partial [Schleiferilactobacillus shenzhenensis]|uniref:hypothetical protein n=1 Tax=Schleiferilactobacillus shenzhenensis TaxID=1231337 RepID=UPI00058C195D